ncbi:MAG: histidinol-phosphate transaminase [Cardiobacteriaceae bacterium]|nr:histidinol-phosphate transaminase [Cardiobacteriaceae bacterium]
MDKIARWVRPAIRQMQAYAVVDLPAGALKLDAMELPADLPPHLRPLWLQTLEKVAMNRYPAAHNAALVANLRDVFALDPALPVMFGNGSDEFIQIIAMTLGSADHTILAPAPSFVMYRMVADILGMNYVGVDLREDFSLDADAMLAAITAHEPAVIFLASPNNPTGNALVENDVRRIIEAAPGLVVLDEAYLAYSTGSLMHLASEYDNVVVMRTLSKTGFAGLRFGYLFGNPLWMAELDKVRPPYNVNVLTQASIAFALEHYAAIAAQAEEIVSERGKLEVALAQMDGVKVYPSQANFVTVRVADGKGVCARMRDAGVWIKSLDGMHPMLGDCLRLTVSNKEENAQMLEALKEALP